MDTHALLTNVTPLLKLSTKPYGMILFYYMCMDTYNLVSGSPVTLVLLAGWIIISMKFHKIDWSIFVLIVAASRLSFFVAGSCCSAHSHASPVSSPRRDARITFSSTARSRFTDNKIIVFSPGFPLCGNCQIGRSKRHTPDYGLCR